MSQSMKAAQGFVNQVFAECMERDTRELPNIIAEIRRQLLTEAAGDLALWWPSDYELQIMVSRNAMGSGDWEYFPAYSRPVRYVSKTRVRQLTKLVKDGRASEAEAAELAEQRADLERGITHFRTAHLAATRRERELAALAEDVDAYALAGVHE